jgi:CBS domain-containing protein
LLVQEIMTKKVKTIDSDKTVFEACELFQGLKVGSLVVIYEDIIVGIITERDVIKQIILESKNPRNTLVKDIMTPNIKTIHSLAKIEEASKLMKKNDIKKLPVVYNDNLVGIITETDISRAIELIQKNL